MLLPITLYPPIANRIANSDSCNKDSLYSFHFVEWLPQTDFEMGTINIIAVGSL